MGDETFGTDGYCVHCDPTSLTCTVHAQRLQVCRSYDCRGDARIWIDDANRIPTPFDAPIEQKRESSFDLVERARLRARAGFVEKNAIGESFAGSVTGPKR